MFINNLKQQGKRYLKSESGLAYIEFAISILVLLILFYGGVEVSRFMLILQKVEKTSMMVSNIASQFDPNATPAQPSANDLLQLENIVPYLLYPYGSPSNEIVIISDVSVPSSGPTTPILNWQSCGGGTAAAVSKIGTANGSAANLPSGFSMDPGEEAIFAEVYYQYSPILTQNIIQTMGLYRISGIVTRNGSFQKLTYTCP